MLVYDEAELVRRLGNLTPRSRVVFAAACAQRLLPAYDRFREERGLQSESNAFADALSEVWSGLDEQLEAGSLQSKVAALKALIPREDAMDDWTTNASVAQNACIAVVYVLRAREAGDPQEAAWAARQTYDALDEYVIASADIDMGAAGSEQEVRSHPLVQAELARQRRDLELLERAGDGAAMDVLRARAEGDASLVFGADERAVSHASGDATNLDDLVACPRCRQAWLREVTLTVLEIHAYLCVECDALYLTEADVAGGSFVDYGTFMEARGRSLPEDPRELRLGTELRRRRAP